MSSYPYKVPIYWNERPRRAYSEAHHYDESVGEKFHYQKIESEMRLPPIKTTNNDKRQNLEHLLYQQKFEEHINIPPKMRIIKNEINIIRNKIKETSNVYRKKSKHKVEDQEEEKEKIYKEMEYFSNETNKSLRYRTEASKKKESCTNFYYNKMLTKIPLMLTEKTTVIYVFAYRKLKKIINVVLFTIYLRKYIEKIRKNGKSYFEPSEAINIKQKLLEIKYVINKGLELFYEFLLTKKLVNYLLMPTDLEELQIEKITSAKKFVNLILNCVHRISHKFNIEIIYYICRHGSFAVREHLFTEEELTRMSLSEEVGYLSADSYLECSNIMLLILFKMLLFNLLLQPENEILIRIKNKMLSNNLKMFGNILYELFKEVQSNYLNKTTCILSNWKEVSHRFKIEVVDSMKLPRARIKPNELISGLHDSEYIQKIYDISEMHEEKKIIKSIVQIIHSNMVLHHKKVREMFI